MKAYRDATYWFPKEDEAEGGINEMMTGLEDVLQKAIKVSRKLPSDSVIIPETMADASGYQVHNV